MIQPGQILIVDDEPSLLKMMSIYLARLGYAVVAAVNAEQALEAVKTQPGGFAVAVLDASLASNGLDDLATQMLMVTPRLCVIAASGYPVDMTLLEAAAPGRVTFLHKPFSPEMLAAAVRRMLVTQEEV
ncbi:MAG TPA: response regulator [Candidatus Acidoferrales bacterium]|nr:response regulator [Candidatus Acidoferrales bacterium]